MAFLPQTSPFDLQKELLYAILCHNLSKQVIEMKINKTIAKRMSKLHGTIRRKEKGGNFYYRLTITSGIRKEFSLKTRDEAEAVQKAEEIDAIYMASTLDVALAQISAIKGFSKLQQLRN